MRAISAPSVLFDAPGPAARRRNMIYTAVFVVALLALGYGIYRGLDAKGQWAWALWEPFFQSSTWTSFLLPGLVATIKAALLAVVIALPFGALLGIGRLSDHKWVRGISGVIVEFFRSIPVLMLMLFGATLYFLYTPIDAETRPLFAVVTALVLYNGSVLAEVFRAGINALPKGQTEAAKALGLTKGQTMRTVLLPQAVTLMLPAIVSQLVVTLKDTALGGQLSIGYTELIRSSGPITGNFGNSIQTYIMLAVLFIAMDFGLTSLASVLQRRISRSRRTPPGAEPVKLAQGGRDLAAAPL